jgi:hypothetical protein
MFTEGRNLHVRRALLVVVLSLLATLALAGTAAAANHQTVTDTQTTHGSWVESGDTNPCTGDTIDVNATGNGVNHITYFVGDGVPTEFWVTFTEAIGFSFVDQGVTYTGRATVWGNSNQNEQNQNTTSTFTIRGTGSDGSVATGHETMHFGVNANGQVTAAFDKMNFTCG